MIYVGTERGVYLLTWSGDQWLIASRRAPWDAPIESIRWRKTRTLRCSMRARVEASIDSADAGLNWEPVGRGLGGADVFGASL